MLSLTTWHLSLQVILLFFDRNQFITHYLIKLMIFLTEINPSKWQQGTLLVIFYNGMYIYRYTFTILQYTFIGWVCRGPAAHLYQVYVRDNSRGLLRSLETNRVRWRSLSPKRQSPRRSLLNKPTVCRAVGTSGLQIHVLSRHTTGKLGIWWYRIIFLQFSIKHLNHLGSIKTWVLRQF